MPSDHARNATPRISVVIPTYNSVPLVVEAVRSVLAQTRPADEVLVVDDGSTDDTAERLAAFGPPVRVIRKANGGVSSARNRGVAEATGDLIAFLDADDVWHPRKLEIQLNVLEKHPDLGMFGTRTFDWPGPMPDPPDSSPQLTRVSFDRLIVRNAFCTSTVLVRTAVIRAAGEFDTSLQGPEDYDLWLRVAAAAVVANLDLRLTGYRLATPNSLSKNAERMEHGLERILAKQEQAGAFRGRPLLRRRAWGYFRYNCGHMHREAGRRWSAVGRTALSLLGYPLPFSRDEVRYPFGRVRLMVSAFADRGKPA